MTMAFASLSTDPVCALCEAMDASLSALTGNETQISNDVYTTAIRNRDNLRNAQAAVDGATRTVDMLQAQISSAASAVWDSDAPAQTAQTAQAAQAVSSSSSNSSAATAGATAATNSTNATNSTTSGASAVLLASNSEVDGCNADLASPVDVDLSTAEHVDAGQIGDKASEALLFWRLAATPGLPSEAAAAESAAIVPKLRIENLGDRLRIKSEKPLMVFLAEGLELPVSFADISVPGQHSLAGKRAAAEVQLVHMPDDPSKAVAVSLQMDAGDTENSWFQHMGDALPRAGDATEVQGTDPMTMHPAFSRGVAGHFFRYKGRLLKDSRCARIRPTVSVSLCTMLLVLLVLLILVNNSKLDCFCKLRGLDAFACFCLGICAKRSLQVARARGAGPHQQQAVGSFERSPASSWIKPDGSQCTLSDSRLKSVS